MNMQQLMKQAQQMQEKLQKQMGEMRVEATAGGGMVTVVLTGTKQLQSITIDPERLLELRLARRKISIYAPGAKGVLDQRVHIQFCILNES